MASGELFVTEVAQLGPLRITNTVITTWAIMLALALTAWFGTRRLTLAPTRLQNLLEAIVAATEEAVRMVLPDQYRLVLPFIGTLWLFIVVANLVSLIPGVRSPTGDLSLTAALALLVFVAVHWYGIRTQGLKHYLRHYLQPNPILLPFHLVSEISRTLALAIRLFGNIFSLQMAALLVLLVAGFLVPVPVLMLHLIEGLVQAYIFGMLALVYVAGAIQSHESKQASQEESQSE